MRIVVLVSEGVEIPRGVVPYATASLLGGSATLQFESPKAVEGVLASDGTATIDGDIRSRLMEQFTDEIDLRMQPVNAAMDEFRILAHNINELVQPIDPDRPGDTGNIRTAVNELNELLVDLHDALALTKTWLGDEQLQIDVRESISGARVMFASTAKTMDEMAVTLEEVRGLVRRATEGNGTVGQLLNNPDLYNSLDDAVVRLDRTLRDLQLLIEKIKSDGLPVIW